jgi:hypothetical protein
LLRKANDLTIGFCSVTFGGPFSLTFKVGYLLGQLLYKNAFFKRTLSTALTKTPDKLPYATVLITAWSTKPGYDTARRSRRWQHNS